MRAGTMAPMGFYGEFPPPLFEAARDRNSQSIELQGVTLSVLWGRMGRAAARGVQ